MPLTVPPTFSYLFEPATTPLTRAVPLHLAPCMATCPDALMPHFATVGCVQPCCMPPSLCVICTAAQAKQGICISDGSLWWGGMRLLPVAATGRAASLALAPQTRTFRSIFTLGCCRTAFLKLSSSLRPSNLTNTYRDPRAPPLPRLSCCSRLPDSCSKSRCASPGHGDVKRECQRRAGAGGGGSRPAVRTLRAHPFQPPLVLQAISHNGVHTRRGSGAGSALHCIG